MWRHLEAEDEKDDEKYRGSVSAPMTLPFMFIRDHYSKLALSTVVHGLAIILELLKVMLKKWLGTVKANKI